MLSPAKSTDAGSAPNAAAARAFMPITEAISMLRPSFFNLVPFPACGSEQAASMGLLGR
jgi:hypothetical protein